MFNRYPKAPVKANVRVQSVKPGGDNFDLDSMMAELEGGSPVRIPICDLRSCMCVFLRVGVCARVYW